MSRSDVNRVAIEVALNAGNSDGVVKSSVTGSLLVSDDYAGAIYRITYVAPQ